MRDIKELYELLDNSTDDTQRIHILFDIATFMLNVSENRVLETIEELEKIAERTDNNLGRSYVHSSRGRMFYRKSMYEEAAREFQLALDKALLTDDLLSQAMCYDSIGIVCNPLHQYDLALETAFKALALYQRIDTQASRWQQIVCYNNIGISYKQVHQLQLAEESFLKGIVLADAENDDRMKSNLLTNLCEVKIEQEAFEEGLGLILRALEGFRKYNHKIGEAHATAFMGHCRLGKGEYALAIQDYLSVLKKLKDVDHKPAEIHAYRGLGHAYCKMEAFSEAIQYYNKGMEVAKAMNSYKDMCEAYLNLGKTYHSLGNTDQAQEYAQLGRDLASERGFVQLLAKFESPARVNTLATRV